jgi:hypothetical protein
MVMSFHQNAGQYHNLQIANKFFANVIMLKYLGTAVTNHNCILEEIKSILNLELLSSIQNLLSSCLLSKILKIIIYKTIILYVVLFGCETWSLTH